MDRSTRTLVASFLWVAALFIAMNTIVASGSPGDWALPLVLVVIGGVVIYYPEQQRGTAEMSVSNTDIENALMVAPPKAIVELPVAAAPISKVPVESSTHEEKIVITESRSDALASVAEPSAEELEDNVDNVSTMTAPTLEETGELSGPPTDSQPRRTTSEMPAAPDDLTVIEGIGPKMSAALVTAGIDTYAKLAAASEDTIREAISAAGMRFAPSLVTWAEQATYAAKGDWDGLKTFKNSLTSGRRGK